MNEQTPEVITGWDLFCVMLNYAAQGQPKVKPLVELIIRDTPEKMKTEISNAAVEEMTAKMLPAIFQIAGIVSVLKDVEEFNGKEGQ